MPPYLLFVHRTRDGMVRHFHGMYFTLVYYTGAITSEHFSIQDRHNHRGYRNA